MNTCSDRQRTSVRPMAGFGLIELMIAMVLGLIVIGAAFVIFQSSQNTFRSNEGLSRIQESARVAFELMSRDIRAAGGSACSNFSVVEGTGAAADRFRNDAVRGAAGSLRVVSGDDTAYRVESSTTTSVTLHEDDVEFASDVFNTGDILILCNARKTHIVQATSVSETDGDVEFAMLPGGYVPTDDEYAPPAAVVLARFRDVTWFVDDNDREGRSLYVSRLGGDPEEVAEGVQDLEFTYLSTGATSYVDAPTDWRDVIAVRITMTLQGADIDGNVLERTVSNVVSMRGRTL